jgi:excisionase family DNA binding protein
VSEQYVLQFPPELVEAIAERAAELIAQRTENAVGGFLDVDGAAAFLACPKSRIYSLTSAGRLPVHRDGSRLLFDPHELRQYVAHGGARRP